MPSRDRSPERTGSARGRTASVTASLFERTRPVASTKESAPGAQRSSPSKDGGAEAVRRRVDVSVMGMTLSVRTDREDAWVHGIAGQVNRRVDELKRTARNANPQQLAVLVALNLAEELQAERQRATGRERQLEGQLETLAEGALAHVREALAALGDGGDDEGGADEDDEEDEDAG